MSKRLNVCAALAGIGALDSAYGLIQHYGPIGSGVCNWGGAISCDIVNKSVFSEIAGIPVALIGIVGYAAIAFVSIRARGSFPRRETRALFALSLLALIFSFYLTWVEIYLLGAICPICIISQIIILAITALAWSVWRSAPAKSEA